MVWIVGFLYWCAPGAGLTYNGKEGKGGTYTFSKSNNVHVEQRVYMIEWLWDRDGGGRILVVPVRQLGPGRYPETARWPKYLAETYPELSI